MTLVIAHRGASADAPENTLEAFELAVAQRADMIETDLHLAADGSVPLWHDDDVDGIAVGSLTLDQLRRLRPDMPTLEETLERFGSRIAFNLELKQAGKRDYAGLEARVLDVVRRMDLLDRTLFSSFGGNVLVRLRELEPRARIGVLVYGSSARSAKTDELARRVRAEAVNPALRVTRRDWVEHLHAQGYRVNVYTVDKLEDQKRLIAWKVDGIFTNRPRQMRALLEAK